MYIAVAGNIGCGKTSLVEMLSIHYNIKPYYEDIGNPYLNDFYQDMERWSFKLQICFLANKITQMRAIEQEFTSVIQDRTVYEEAMIFVKNLKNMLLLTPRDYDAYLQIYNLLLQGAPKPQLLIYLKSNVDTLIKQIKKRGRSFEQNIQPEYLLKLNELYDNWAMHSYEGEKLVIEIDEIDFVQNKTDLCSIIRLIDEKITQLNITI